MLKMEQSHLLCFNISFKKTQVPFCNTNDSLVEIKTIQVQDLDWPPAASLLQLESRYIACSTRRAGGKS